MLWSVVWRRDERGCINEQVVKNLVIAYDFVPGYVVGPYLRISEYLNNGWGPSGLVNGPEVRALLQAGNGQA